MSMIILCPIGRSKERGNSLETLESKLKDLSVDEIFSKMSYQEVRLSLPRFSIMTHSSLKDTLQKVNLNVNKSSILLFTLHK